MLSKLNWTMNFVFYETSLLPYKGPKNVTRCWISVKSGYVSVALVQSSWYLKVLPWCLPHILHMVMFWSNFWQGMYWLIQKDKVPAGFNSTWHIDSIACCLSLASSATQHHVMKVYRSGSVASYILNLGNDFHLPSNTKPHWIVVKLDP
jgi:hypothetical protein